MEGAVVVPQRMKLFGYLLLAPPWPWWALALQAALAALAAWFLALPGTYQTLFWFSVADFATGISCAVFTRSGISARELGRGGCKKAGYFVLCWMTHSMKAEMKLDIDLGLWLGYFFLFTEAVSITENLAELGVPVPSQLVEILTRLREAANRGPKGA